MTEGWYPAFGPPVVTYWNATDHKSVNVRSPESLREHPVLAVCGVAPGAFVQTEIKICSLPDLHGMLHNVLQTWRLELK